MDILNRFIILKLVIHLRYIILLKMIKVKKGKKARIIVKVRPSTKVVFASANKKIAAVTKKGMLKGMKKGRTKIKVKCYGITKTVIVIVK